MLRRMPTDSMIPFSPADVENTFGLPVDEHRTTIEIAQ